MTDFEGSDMEKGSRKMWIVTPGEKIQGRVMLRRGENSFFIRIGNSIVATHLGVLKKTGGNIDLIPYKSVYIPKKDDYVIGVIIGYAPNGWIVDIGSSTKAFLAAQEFIKWEGNNQRFDPKKYELSEHFKIGDLVGAVIIDINAQSHPILSLPQDKPGINKKHLGKLQGYFIIKVHTTKIPRIIGRKGSMIKMIKENLEGDIIIGQNGVILYKGSYENFLLLKRIIKTIISSTFAPGLTGRIAEMLGATVSEQEAEDSQGEM